MADLQKMKDACPNYKANLAQCTCSYGSCDKTGLCCQCVSYHRKAGQIPGCFFSAEGEASYDRSYANFCRDIGR
ncbi:conserved hypothetical protein [Desulfarculus baarsii DSM 2075]|uniref:Cytosolic protein n=1 Tax=Desulfarculus baarsii (strain ATCC 33931 / DSM 2075 / LMG 7858 / VKM B-1802 / 2st14) TaxID=644282 RepID=E1QFF7_DESB2|nr:DUF6485 family protein [Desulfarculus baarsii]ADK84293.1 conserved hypothetical protein [Desulfarculus baarsii DSM 2075]